MCVPGLVREIQEIPRGSQQHCRSIKRPHEFQIFALHGGAIIKHCIHSVQDK
jgi:hypothetical protein